MSPLGDRRRRTGAGAVDRRELENRLDQAVASTEPLPTPLAVVDLDAFDANADDLARRADGTPIRLATKSVRVPALIKRALEHPGFNGALCYTLAEALWLEENALADDLLVAYPTVDRASLRRLLAYPRAAERVTIMIDDPAQLDVVDSVRDSLRTMIRVALDIDAGLHAAGQHVGPKRSPLRDARAVIALARTVEDRPGFALVGVMTYEGQVAGVPDDVPTQRLKSRVVRQLKHRSVDQLLDRRREVAGLLQGVQGLAGRGGLEFWNAGGSGSIETSAADPAVTELSAGSGLLVPTSFDHFLSFSGTPAAFFGLPVTRRPSADVATVHGGGLVASGASGADRLPTPWLPAGLRLSGLEGAGEVQTPVQGPAAGDLSIGDLVWFRHTKSGELFEHVGEVSLLQGDRFVDRVPTYRGHGLAF